MNGKQILITTESHEVIVIRRAGRFGTSGYCPHCKTRIEGVDPDDRDGVLGKPAEETLVHRYIEADLDRDHIDEDKLQGFEETGPDIDGLEANKNRR